MTEINESFFLNSSQQKRSTKAKEESVVTE